MEEHRRPANQGARLGAGGEGPMRSRAPAMRGRLRWRWTQGRTRSAATEAMVRESCGILKTFGPGRDHGQRSQGGQLMVPKSPSEALGHQAAGVRDLIVDVVRDVHERFAAAHSVSGSKYAMGFGSQWRDLLDEAQGALAMRGFDSHKLAPGGHRVGIVNGCLVYVWRAPEDPTAISNFASSPTRQNGFVAPTPPEMLWDPTFNEGVDPAGPSAYSRDRDSVAALMAAVGAPMPMVLVLVHSVPWQLQKIEWGVAELDADGKVELHGRCVIWEPEGASGEAGSEMEPFDSGTPSVPVVKLQIRDRPGLDA